MKKRISCRDRLANLMKALVNEKSDKWILVLKQPRGAEEKFILKEKIRLATNGLVVRTGYIKGQLYLLRKLTKMEFAEFQNEIKNTRNVEDNYNLYWYRTLKKSYITMK